MSDASRLANGDSEAYWAGIQEGRLLFQKCNACGAVQFPPRHHCATCWAADLSWVESSGKGTIESFTIVRRAPLPAFRDKAPYVVVSVILAEGPRMITSLEGEGAEAAQIGDTVRVGFGDGSEGDRLPHFRLAER